MKQKAERQRSGGHVLQRAWEWQRARTTCRRGHPIPPYSGFGIVRVCKVCSRITHRAKDKEGNVPEDRIQQAVKALKAGMPVSRLGGIADGKSLGPGSFIIRPARLYAYCRANPLIGKPIAILIAKNNRKAMIEVWRKAAAVNRLRHKRTREMRFSTHLIVGASENVFDVIRDLCKRLPVDVREDVFQDASVAAIERSAGPLDATAIVAEMSAKHFRFVSRFVPVVGGLMRSLDEQRFEDSPRTLGDTVTRGLWDE